MQFGITWRPTPGGVFSRFHISDIWLDDEAMQNATQHQTELHKTFIRSRWMPAWVDAVEYGKFGRATVTATLFGGMDPTLYADFKAAVLARGRRITPDVMEGQCFSGRKASYNSLTSGVVQDRATALMKLRERHVKQPAS